MAYRDGKPVGRICALINRKFNEYHQANIGFFGFFDCVNDEKVSAALFEAGEKKKKENMDTVISTATCSVNIAYSEQINKIKTQIEELGD